MQILGVMGMYFDAVVEVKKNLLLFRLTYLKWDRRIIAPIKPKYDHWLFVSTQIVPKLNNLRKFRLIYEQLLNNNMSFYGFNDEILCRSHKQYPVRLQWNYVLVCKAGPPNSWRSIIKGQGLPWLKEILKLPFSSIYLIWFKRTSEEILTAGNPKFWYIFFSQN